MEKEIKNIGLVDFYHIAKLCSSYDEFKSKIDEIYNGTPLTVLDKTKYTLVKIEE